MLGTQRGALARKGASASLAVGACPEHACPGLGASVSARASSVRSEKLQEAGGGGWWLGRGLGAAEGAAGTCGRNSLRFEAKDSHVWNLEGRGKCVLGRRAEFSVHTDLFLALEKQDVQSGLYQLGRGRRFPCPQETIHKFLAANACCNFRAEKGAGGRGREEDFIWLFLRVDLSEASWLWGCLCSQTTVPNGRCRFSSAGD